MLEDSEGEEETTRLLSDSATPSPVRPHSGSSAAVRPSEQSPGGSVLLLPRPGWQAGAPLLQLRPAEKTFLAMSGVLGPCDGLDQVPDSMEVVRSILSELEADADEMDSSLCLDQEEPCTCHAAGEVEGEAHGSLVVDVHQGALQRCAKHTTERFPRCYSESHRQRDGAREGAPQLLCNLDKIDTVGPVGEQVGGDRLRHFSESAVGVGKRRRATFSSELRQLRRSLTSAGRSQHLEEKGPEGGTPAHRGSMDTIGSEVRFDIWEEGERGEEGRWDPELGEVVGGVMEEEQEYTLPFDYVPHPLVVGCSSVWTQSLVRLIRLSNSPHICAAQPCLLDNV